MRIFWKACVFFVVHLPTGTLKTMKITPPMAETPST